jgi:hypothetical protein
MTSQQNIKLDEFPIAFDVISKAQLNDNKIQQCITNNDPSKEKIVIPAKLHSHILTWYHENLLHPGANQMFHTISQHFTWPSLCTQVENFVKHCYTCQHYKAQRKKYGHIPILDKQLIANHGTQLQSIPLHHGSFCSHTFFDIKRAYNTSSTYNHQPKHALHGNCGIEKQE